MIDETALDDDDYNDGDDDENLKETIYRRKLCHKTHVGPQKG